MIAWQPLHKSANQFAESFQFNSYKLFEFLLKLFCQMN